MPALSTPLTPVQSSTVAKAVETHNARKLLYELCQNYYDGQQNVKMTARLRKILAQQGYFRSNFCGLVIDTMIDRLEVTGFRTENDDLSEWMWNIWKASRFDEEQVITHTQAAIKGDSYCIVDWDQELAQPRMNYNDAKACSIFYHEADRKSPRVALKTWAIEEGQRVNLYWPDRVEKYITSKHGGGWTGWLDEGDTGWPIPWPIGRIPVFHFHNRPAGGAYGQSEIANIVPLQDALNKSLIDLFQSMDSTGFPTRWVTGATKPASGWKFAIGDVWHFTDLGARTGIYDPPNLHPMIEAIDKIVDLIAAISRTPAHIFKLGGTPPSGEALKTSEAGLVAKVIRRQTVFGNTYEDVMRHCILQQGKFGKGSRFDSTTAIDTLWASAETRSRLADAQVTQILAPIISEEEALRINGYTGEEITTIKDEKAANKAAGLNLGEAL